MQLSRKQKAFSESFSEFLKSNLNLNIFKKKITLIPDAFPKLKTLKNFLRSMSK